ncbi:MAG TPA: HAD-IA family hydrolase [Solirubrobacteraceae bacterium]
MRQTAIPTANALLLDALGTLVRLTAPAPALRDELARRFGVSISERQAERALAAEIGYYRTHLQDGRDEPSLRDLRRRCAEVLREALPPPLAGAEIEPLTQVLLSSLRFSAFDDAQPALAAARARGQRVVVTSNWDVSLGEVLGRIGLAPLLDGVVTSAGVGARKPDPAIFEAALAVAGCPAEQAVHVGDSVEEDIAGARAAGVPAVLLRRDGGPGPAGVMTIASLVELA